MASLEGVGLEGLGRCRDGEDGRMGGAGVGSVLYSLFCILYSVFRVLRFAFRFFCFLLSFTFAKSSHKSEPAEQPV